MTEPRDIRIQVPVLARVEGEGALQLDIRDGEVKSVKLKIYEPPRLFEKFLEGRSYTEVPDLVARICGICPVAYQMSAVQALENCLGVEPEDWVRDMRRVFYCGEWIQSHSLHIHLLAAPDFLGFNGVTDMAEKHPDEVRRGLGLQNLGNQIIKLLGGRSVHPVGARVGGFHRAPTVSEVTKLLDQLRLALADSEALVQWTASLDLPEGRQAFRCIALRADSDYPMIADELYTGEGDQIPIADFSDHFQEFQVPHSTALHALYHEQPYLVGPLARLNLNLDRLPGPVTRLLENTGISWPSQNMFHSIVARALEINYAIHEAIDLLTNYRKPDRPYVEVEPSAGIGYGCSEAPRGSLWHRYELDERGHVVQARIVPPTSQNQARIEHDLKSSLTDYGLSRPDHELRKHAEMVIRNYDPCISCATHFLKLEVNR